MPKPKTTAGLAIALLTAVPTSAIATSPSKKEINTLNNTSIDSFSKAKKIMQQHIYTTPELRRTMYCDATFDEEKKVNLPLGFHTDRHKNRMPRWEAEHVVPAENFGRSFVEWWESHEQCVDSKGIQRQKVRGESQQNLPLNAIRPLQSLPGHRQCQRCQTELQLYHVA